ncbi:hypothetical protein [Chitinophaga eiseniae]|uniref:Beta-lactamase-inhibitor-like, PepSY-like n=1 Tax=Chitinophaga eiseniae TaxID=634771 RepID=A0A847STE2_9BACT|nr:hypothetical protein [Chitinophaga eiseniae]NLR81388.1 hypothetical protein [Chitinophaga eiseniae]
MKKVIMLLAFTAVTCSVYAQSSTFAMSGSRKEARKERHERKITLRELKSSEVSFQSKQAFDRDFDHTTNMVWTHDVYFDKVSFLNEKGMPMSAYYDYDAKLVGTTAPAKFTDLPVAAQKDIAKHFSNYEKAPVVFFDDNEANETDMILYGMQFEDADNYFIELKDKKNQPVVLRVDMLGNVEFFAEMSDIKF